MIMWKVKSDTWYEVKNYPVFFRYYMATEFHGRFDYEIINEKGKLEKGRMSFIDLEAIYKNNTLIEVLDSKALDILYGK